MNEVQVTRPITQGLLPQHMQAQFGNQYAQAMANADPRYQLKQLDRPGFSRGEGQMYQAGINASKALADGIADAYSQQLNNQQFNANTQLQSQSQQEQQSQQLAAFQSQQAYADQMARLQAINLLGGLLR